ncbi:hypothetical protein ACJJTC_017076 [Scirpophaga incertulas]
MLVKICLLGLLTASARAGPTRIVGGNPTTVEKYPSIVQVEFRSGSTWMQACAANIVHRQYVVSAAHCFDGALFNVASRRIRAGSSNRNIGGYIIHVDQVTNHPSYNTRTNDGDITLVKLSKALVYSESVQPVQIAWPRMELPANLPVVHAGWGTTTQGGSMSPILRDVTIYTISRSVCQRRYRGVFTNRRITQNMICAGIDGVGGQDACQGDSGGPMYYDGILVGIVSWGRGCANAHYPGVSTKVSMYTNWILANTVKDFL